MVFMALLFALIYITLIAACGAFFLRKWEMDPVLLFPTGFMLGSVIIGAVMFVLVTVSLISPLPIALLVVGMLILGIFGISGVIRSLKAAGRFWTSHVYVGRFRLVLTAILLAGLVLYLADASTPPRSADAMRYHLAQMAA